MRSIVSASVGRGYTPPPKTGARHTEPTLRAEWPLGRF
jgi:hypothetical protein